MQANEKYNILHDYPQTYHSPGLHVATSRDAIHRVSIHRIPTFIYDDLYL